MTRADPRYLTDLRACDPATGSVELHADIRYPRVDILQSDDLILPTVLVAPTSRSARASSFRPTITIGGERTLVRVEQTSAVAPERLGQLVGHVSRTRLVQCTTW
ncbi:type II toxin-antitoxin system PemK/MazF family toxin [Cryobacterium sp. Y11]|uniref:type II toxin-antitoxin system PemK/MazF family toxin n=1 Tax=Cryobacterium sp. Y11 TaxID=2045016 RepID=UPI000CE423A7|nr:type II toxin-antitoxin system PemK/MazF family toxin [Cryobacterium sp. Y11]